MTTKLGPGDFVTFGSGGKIKELSNLYHCSVKLTEMDPVLLRRSPQLKVWLEEEGGVFSFPSLEHLYQGLKARNKQTFLRFTEEGDFGKWDPNFFKITVVALAPSKRAKYAKKIGKPKAALTVPDLADLAIHTMNYWKAKGLIGIMAKLASNRSYGKALNLGPSKMDYASEWLSAQEEQDLWLVLEALKYNQNPRLMDILLGTNTKVLVEFDKGATTRKVHWGGAVKDGVVMGDNVMGKYLMMIRAWNLPGVDALLEYI